MSVLAMAGAAATGAVLSALVACLPGLHVYNVMGLLVMLLHAMPAGERALPPEIYLPFLIGLVVGWSLLNSIPSILLGAPDESAIFTVLPGQKYLMFGRGFEGTMITAVGGLGGLYFLVLLVAPLAPRVLPAVQDVMRPHMHVVLWVIITYILMSEWPKGGNWGPAGWARFLEAWRSLAAGLATFLLSGLLGFLLIYRSPVSTDVAFQNILPAFVGLFAVPWCLTNILSAGVIPPQFVGRSLDLTGDVVLRGVAAGGLGGGFAAFFPVITGGIGGLLAGQAAAQRDERVFLVSQGVSKLVYYTGAFLLFFVPGLGLTRGAGAWLMRGLFTPRTHSDYFMVVGAIAVGGAVAYLMMEPLARAVLALIARFDYRYVSAVALIVILLFVYFITGGTGLAVTAVASGIGLLPVLYGSRRLNALGVLLLPMACNMSGFGHQVAAWLRLI